MIIIKDDSVKLKVITPSLALMFYVIELYHRNDRELQPSNLYITSINDGIHVKNSRHYKNEAFDMRSKNFKSKNKEPYRKAIEAELNIRCSGAINKFTVLLQYLNTDNEHFHFQVKKGKVYP